MFSVSALGIRIRGLGMGGEGFRHGGEGFRHGGRPDEGIRHGGEMHASFRSFTGATEVSDWNTDTGLPSSLLQCT